jgi:hypothetical protein
MNSMSDVDTKRNAGLSLTSNTTEMIGAKKNYITQPVKVAKQLLLIKIK